MTAFRLFNATIAATIWGAAALAQTPGTVESGPPPAPVAPAAPRPAYLAPETRGLQTFYRVYGRYQLSVDATGRSLAKSSTVKVVKPAADAVVAKAFLMATTYAQVLLTSDSVKLEGKKVGFFATVLNDLPDRPGYFNSGLADVTSIVKARIDAAPAGEIRLQVTEPLTTPEADWIDGETLVVVFETPSDTKKRTLALLFGAQNVNGDTYEITLNKPIDRSAEGARAEMGLGVSFSYQANRTQQYSIINVNGQRMTTAAGGEDDGETANGGLMTAGGFGDKPTNPADPNAGPTDPRSDDERYSLLPFISKKDRVIRVTTVNPSQDDNIFFAYFDLTGNADIDADSDGDGLLDAWEISGYDHDDDGVIDVDLPALGADPDHKDLFIAYAWMVQGASDPTASHQPTQATLDAVSAAFARAPVANPDGVKGVKLHWRNLGSVPHDDDLNGVWFEFDNLMNPKLTEAERRIYRRMLNAHAYDGGSSSGLARGIPSSDFIESLGKFSSNPGTFAQRAGTIMHELGHTLGLRHGGVDHENYKANHLSVMSYLNQLSWLKKGGAPFLDYDRFSLGDLDETALNEGEGLDATAGDAALSSYAVRWVAGGFIREKASGAGGKVDWNLSGSTQNSVALDINDTGTQSILRGGFIEWDNIAYAAGSVGANPMASFLAARETDLKELTEEEFLQLTTKKRRDQ